MLRPDGFDGLLVLRGSGRDIRTGRDGEPVVLRTASLDLEVDLSHGRAVRSISSDPVEPGLQRLKGTSAAAGFRRAALAAVPHQAEAGSLLYQLLDDVPVTSLISGYAIGAAGRAGAASGMASRVDICAGFQSGGSMRQLESDLGVIPTVVGPAAPDVGREDPAGWQDVGPLSPGDMRRRRLLDVIPGERFVVHSWFRDSYQRSAGEQTIVHEYEVDAVLDPAGWTVDAISVTPHVLPWFECPQAAASGSRLIGSTVRDLRAEIRATFVGTSTCTHLNDQFRSLTDVVVLAEACSTSS